MKISLICPKGHISETIDNSESALVIDLENKTYRLYCDQCGEWYVVKLCIEENCPIFKEVSHDTGKTDS